MFIDGHTKEELQSWDAQVREGLGAHAEYHQSRQLIMWTDTFGKAEHWAKWRKRHAGKAAHWVSSGSKDCQRKSARTEDSSEWSLVQEEQQTHHLLRRRLNGMERIIPRWFLAKLEPSWWSRRSFERVVKTPTPHEPPSSSCTSSFLSQSWCSSQKLHYLKCGPRKSGLCFVFRAQTSLVLRRPYSEMEVVVCPYRTHTVRTSNTPWFLLVTECIHLSQVTSRSTRFNEAKKYTNEKRPSHAHSPGRKSLMKYDEQFTPSTSDTFRWFLRHRDNHESDDCASGIC